MLAAQKVEPQISELMTWEEITTRYPDQWVCLVDFQWVDPDAECCVDFTTARVAAAGASRREVMERSKPLWSHYEGMGHHYTGELSPPPFPRFLVP